MNEANRGEDKAVEADDNGEGTSTDGVKRKNVVGSTKKRDLPATTVITQLVPAPTQYPLLRFSTISSTTSTFIKISLIDIALVFIKSLLSNNYINIIKITK